MHNMPISPISTLSEVDCRKCGHKNYAAVVIYGPKITYITDQEQLDRNRTDILLLIDGSKLPEEQKAALKKFYSNPGINITHEDVGSIADDIRNGEEFYASQAVKTE